MERSPSDNPLGLQPVEVPRAASVLARHLRDRILTGELPPGEMLPSERDLASASGLSRGSVREALRVLALEDLVETKPGRNGGTFVRRPSIDPLLHTLSVFIRGRQVRHRTLLEIREIIEPDCAALAAHRVSDAQVNELGELTVRMRSSVSDVARFLTLNAEWHIRIAEYSRNELLSAFMSSIAEELRNATDIDGFNSPEIVQDSQQVHESIVDALRERDADAARRRMARHVHAFREAAWDRVEAL